MPSKTQKPPSELSKESRLIWKKLIAEYGFEDEGGLQLLKIYCEAYDRARECRNQIDTEGMQVRDRFGQLKPHALLTALKESQSIMLTALRQMNLDVIGNFPAPGRPSGK